MPYQLTIVSFGSHPMVEYRHGLLLRVDELRSDCLQAFFLA